jgi:signal transduction histidine kinase
MLLRARTGEGVEVGFDGWDRDGVASLPTEFEVSTRSGETRVLECSFAGTRTEPASLVVVARDVTRQREIDRMRDDFVATVSHELRTPLTSIIGFTSMLMEPPRPLTEHEQAESLAMVRKGARRLERLVFNLLEVSRIEARTQLAPTVPVDVDAACRDVVAEMQETYPGRAITVRAGSGALRAIGNRLSIEQILGNLVGNALKYGDGSPVAVEVDESAADSVTLRVSDRGPGIPESEFERVFERFHRLDHQTVQAGTGLGLYISRQLATAMGGTLTVSSNGGKGASFSLNLPAEVHLVAA